MPYVFNPFTGNFDIVDTNTAAGSDTQVQFNDGGTLAGDTALTWNKTSDQLTISGDVNLDSGGSFSTTIQSVTPTANRTISFPDQTGTVGLVAGATGNIQYNNSGALAGSANLNTELTWNSSTTVFTGLKVNVTDTNSAADSKLLDLQSGGTSIIAVSIETTVGNLPAGVGVGQLALVSDGDASLAWGDTVVNSGSGATPYLCWYNGTAWTVIGK